MKEEDRVLLSFSRMNELVKRSELRVKGLDQLLEERNIDRKKFFAIMKELV